MNLKCFFGFHQWEFGRWYRDRFETKQCAVMMKIKKCVRCKKIKRVSLIDFIKNKKGNELRNSNGKTN